jgi:protein ImuA
MPAAAPAGALDQLRRAVAKIDPSGAALEAGGTLRLGLWAIDAALQGGLALGALHEVTPASAGQFGAPFGFALALAVLAMDGQRTAFPSGALPNGTTLLIGTDFGAYEAGNPYGPGLDLFGLATDRLLFLQVSRPLDVLWAFEEALKSRAIAAVLAELPEAGVAADLTASRRLALAARAGGGLGLLLRQRPSQLPTAAMSRWQVAAAPSLPDRFGGLGRTAFDLDLSRNRRGHDGCFRVCWDHHERSFLPSLSLGVAQTAGDRPADARPLVRSG